MKRVNVPQIILEAIVILGYLIIGVTILTYLIQKENITITLINLIIITVGVLGFAEFVTLKMAAKLKSIQSMVASLVGLALGITLMVIRPDVKTISLIWGIFAIAFSLARITTSCLNILRQPLLNIVRTLTSITCAIFGIFLIVKRVDAIYPFFTFIGIGLLVEALVLLIEFLIHRYQN